MERLNDILGYKNRRIYQDDNSFSFSLDSVVLANYASIRKNTRNIVDLCTGNAVVPLILSLRTDAHIDGVEILDNLYDMGVRSVEYNKLDKQIELFNSDIKDYYLRHIDNYDLITCNPPYFKVNESNYTNLTVEKRIARHEVKINLDEVVEIASKMLHDKGLFAIVHRTDRLLEVLETLKKYDLEPKRIMFVYTKLSKNSELFFVEARKNGNSGLKVEKPLILYSEDGKMTEEYSQLLLEVRK